MGNNRDQLTILQEGLWEDSTLIESEGSEPDRAAFLAAARLSTSSETSSFTMYIYKKKLEGRKMKFKFKSSVLIILTN